MSFELRAVSRAYAGRPALRAIQLTLAAGEPVAVLGRSGSGKSTLLRLIAGLDSPTVGQVLLDGTVASEPGRILVPAHRRGIAMVFQDLALWPDLTVLGNVLLGLSGSGLPRAARKTRAAEALELCGIHPLARRRPGQLSGGEQQRAALARALAVRPTFLLLDEPFSGLDLVTRTHVIEEIARLSAAQGITVVLVTHEPLDALSLCRRAVVLEEGSIVEEGPFAELLRAPRSRLLAVLKERIGSALERPSQPPP